MGLPELSWHWKANQAQWLTAYSRMSIAVFRTRGARPPRWDVLIAEAGRRPRRLSGVYGNAESAKAAAARFIGRALLRDAAPKRAGSATP